MTSNFGTFVSTKLKIINRIKSNIRGFICIVKNRFWRDSRNMSPCEGIKYLCRQCGKQFSQKVRLAEHEKAVHEGVKFPCRQCNYQATTKGSLAQHKRAVHEGVKYSCRQCNHQATTKRNIARHQRVKHEGFKHIMETQD